MLQALFTRPTTQTPKPMKGSRVLAIGHAVPGGGRSGECTISQLRSILEKMRSRGFRFCYPGELSQRLNHGSNGSEVDRLLVVALEGGCRCQRDFVLPLLTAMKIPRTLFLNPNKLGEDGFISQQDLALFLREGVLLGGLWDIGTRLESLSTPDAAWNLELLYHRLSALVPSGERKNRGLWLALQSEKGDERIVTLARAAGFAGVVDGAKISRPYRLSRQGLSAQPGQRKWWFSSKIRVFQGVYSGGR